MRKLVKSGAARDWLALHAVEVAFVGVVIFWLWYILRLTRDFDFLSDDLVLIQRGGSWDGMLEPYNGALAFVSVLFDRGSAEVGNLSYTPFLIPGALCLLAVPVTYFFTSRRRLGPPLAAVLAMPLLWFNGMNLRPAQLNHLCALVGGVVCAAALDRGRRADVVLFTALLFALFSAGAGSVIVGACLIHSALVRPHLRRWLAIFAPAAVYLLWLAKYGPLATTPDTLTFGEKVRVVRDLVLEPFQQVAFHFWPLAAVLVIAFLAWGVLQLRNGLAAGANFVAWTAAMIGWALGLIHTRGVSADATVFRYDYVSLGFALLAVVPRKPIRWPERVALTNTRWLAVAAVIVLLFGGVRAINALAALRTFSAQNALLGDQVKGTMVVLQLGPTVIPDDTPLRFFNHTVPHGTAADVRALMRRYGSPFHPTISTVDQSLVDLRTVQSKLGSPRRNLACKPLSNPVKLAPTTVGEAALGDPSPGVVSTTGPSRYRLWTKHNMTIEVRRFGGRFVRLARVPAQHYVYLTLPILSSERPWEIAANGACLTN